MAIKKKKYRITTQAESEFLATVRRFVTKIARKAGFDEENILKIQLAVDEVKISAFPFKKNQIIMTMYRKPCSHNSGPLINEHSKQGEPRCVLRDTRRKWEKHRMKSLERN
jgi:hypothetical protein